MAKTSIDERVRRLEEHLRLENPVLAGSVGSFQRLDRVARQLGLLDTDDSFAVQVSWWPVIAVLGTFSSGKSTFLNEYSGHRLQRTGNQAVDDRFTVICYGNAEEPAVLPGLALDSDPRFPFYQISRDIESVANGEGRQVDSYLQLKTCKAEALRGKIFIDSPGFDADEQRTSTLHIANHIIDLSDLVLVFFDARHPESGAMGDTLRHLVSETVSRPDAAKFLYILNQIDNAAREDNPEEVVAAWQRALAQHGLTAGRFYRIYARSAAVPMEDDQIRDRLERKRDEDMDEIQARIHQVEIERAYRVVGALEKTARRLRDDLVPRIRDARRLWRRRTFWLTGTTLAALLVLFLAWSIGADQWDGLTYLPLARLDEWSQVTLSVIGVVMLVALYLLLKRVAGRSVQRTLRRNGERGRDRDALVRAFQCNTRAWWCPIGSSRPRGWTGRTRKQLDAIITEADAFVESLNDRYANPSGVAPEPPANPENA
jgi:GTPase Era involved in 16S rRNA processing